MPCDLCIKLKLALVEFTTELALKGVLCTHLASKGFLMSGFPPPQTVSIAATAGVIWLCACVRYWPYRGVGTCASVYNLAGSRWFIVESDFSQTN